MKIDQVRQCAFAMPLNQVSQVLTLYTTPVVYLTIEKLRLRVAAWKRKLRGLRTGAVGEATAEAGV